MDNNINLILNLIGYVKKKKCKYIYIYKYINKMNLYK